MSAWALLLVAGIGELVGFHGFQRVSAREYRCGPWLLVCGFALGLVCLHAAAQTLSLAIAYAVFSAVGTLGSLGLGRLFYGETISHARLAWLAMVLIAIVALRLTGSAP